MSGIMAVPEFPANSHEHTELFDVSDWTTDTDEDSEPQTDSQQQLHTYPDTHQVESHTSHKTRPNIDGDLHIHTVLDCGCEVMMCQFSEDGCMLAAGLNNGSIKVYSTENSELIQTLKHNSSCLFTMPVTALNFTVTDQSQYNLLATYASGVVCCWHVWGGQKLWESHEMQRFGGDETGVQRQTLSLAVSPSGEQALTGGSDSTIHLYDLTTQQRKLIFSASSSRTVMDGHRFRVFAVKFHPQREREFISGGWDDTIQFWDTRQQQSIRMISGPHICGDALQIDPITNQILTGSWRKCNTLEVWDYSSGKKVSEVPHDSHGESRIYTCHWLGQEHVVAAGSQPNMLRVINQKSFSTESCLFGLSSAVFSSSVCPSGRWNGLIAASSGRKVFLLERGQCAKT